MKDSDNQLVSWSGSDSSYDLIVQVIRAQAPGEVMFEILGMERTPRLEAFMTHARAFGQELLQELLNDQDENLRFRCIIAQRVPETFVWQARMRSALEKAMDSALDYGAVATSATEP